MTTEYVRAKQTGSELIELSPKGETVLRKLRARRGPLLSVGFLLIVGPILGLLLIIVAQMVPDEIITERLLEGQTTGQLSNVDYPVSGYGNAIDKFSECATLTVGLDSVGDPGAITSALRSYIPSIDCTGMVAALTAIKNNQPVGDGVEYFRYWHGYSIITRPLLSVADVAVLRTVITIGLFGSMVLLGFRIARLYGLVAAAILLGPLLLATDFLDLPASIPHAVATTAALCAALLTLRHVTRHPRLPDVLVASLGSGIIIAYFDILIVAPTSWCLTMALVSAVVFSRSGSVRRALAAGMVSASAWIFGYCWMWMMKWVFTMPVEGVRPVLENVRGAATYRLDGERADVDPTLGASLARNLRFWIERPLGLAATLALVAVLVMTIATHQQRKELAARLISVALVPTLGVIAWYVAFSNHTQVHIFLTYRTLAVGVGIVGFAATMRTASGSEGLHHQSRLGTMPVRDADGEKHLAESAPPRTI